MLENVKVKVIKKLNESKTGLLFVLPLFMFISVFSYYPAFSGIYYSFFKWEIDGTSEFIGLSNFISLFRDPIFLNSIPVIVRLMLPKLIIFIIVPFIMAEMIFFIKSSRTQYWYRVLCLVPMVAPGVVGILIWKYIYDPSGGLAVTLARITGIVQQNQNIDWLGNPDLTIGSIIFMGFPWVGGTAVLIYMSGLMNIGGEIREASLLDGASTIKRIFSIDIPLIMGQIRYFVILGIITALQDYSVQIVITDGGPGYATYVPGYYMFKQAFTFGNMGYASSIGTILFLVIFIFTLMSIKLLKSND